MGGPRQLQTTTTNGQSKLTDRKRFGRDAPSLAGHQPRASVAEGIVIADAVQEAAFAPQGDAGNCPARAAGRGHENPHASPQTPMTRADDPHQKKSKETMPKMQHTERRGCRSGLPLCRACAWPAPRRVHCTNSNCSPPSALSKHLTPTTT